MVDANLHIVTDNLVCPECMSGLMVSDRSITCSNCNSHYSIKDGIFSFLPEEETHYWQKFHTESLQKSSNATEQVNYISEKHFWRANTHLQRILGGRKGCTVLDVGCGHGLMSQWLTTDNTVVGADYSHEMLLAAKERGLFPIHADGLRLPLKKEFFDLVMSVEVVQCMDNAEEYVAGLAKFVKPGGTLLVSGLSSHSVLRQLFWRFHAVFSPGNILPKLVDPIALAKVLTDKGFNVEMSYTCYPFKRVIHEKTGEFRKYRMASTFFIKADKLS